MCQYNNILRVNGDKPLKAYKALRTLCGKMEAPFGKTAIDGIYYPYYYETGKTYHEGVEYLTPCPGEVGRGFFHCFETLISAKKYSEEFYSAMVIVEVEIPPYTEYYEGTTLLGAINPINAKSFAAKAIKIVRVIDFSNKNSATCAK